MSSTNGIFQNNAKGLHLSMLWYKRERVIRQERIETLADLLLEYRLAEVFKQEEAIFSLLKEKIATAQDKKDLRVPIWTFNFLPRKLEKALFEGTDDLREHIMKNGWFNYLELNPMTSSQRMSVMEIVRDTDFCCQLAARFGSNFTVSYFTKEFRETGPSGEPFIRYEATLFLNYFPYGLPAYIQERNKTDVRPPRKLSRGERLYYYEDGDFVSWTGY